MPKTQTFPSQTIPTADFTLIAPVTGRVRNNVELALAGANQRQRVARYSYNFPQLPDNKGLELSKMTPADIAEAARIEGEFLETEREIVFQWGRELFVSAKLPDTEDIDSFDKLLDEAPDTFVQEVLRKSAALCGLTPEQSGESKPLSTSPAAEGGETSGTTAIAAS